MADGNGIGSGRSIDRIRAQEFLRGGAEVSSQRGPMPAVQHLFPAYRVFLFGFDVTKDVTAITIQQHIGRQPNQCNITLLNERDKYVLTTEDVFFLTRINPDLVIQSEEGEILLSEEVISRLRNRRKFITGDPPPEDDFSLFNPLSVKSDIFTLKQAHKRVPVDIIDAEGNIATGQIERSRFPFADGSAMFHANDPVRVFVRELTNPAIWYYGFSGLITDVTDDVSNNHQKTLTIAAEDPTKIFRYARSVTNPGILDSNARSAADQTGTSAYTSQYAGLNVVEVFDRLVFGNQEGLPAFNVASTDSPEETLDQLKKRAITTGILGLSLDTQIAISALGVDASGAALEAKLTPDEKRKLDAFINRQSSLLAEREAGSLFQIDFVNRFGETLQRTFGTEAVGAFKAARGLSRFGSNSPLLSIPMPRITQGSATVDDVSIGQSSGIRPNPFDTESQNSQSRARSIQVSDIGPHVFSLGEDPELENIQASPVSLEQWNSIIHSEVRFSDLTKDAGIMGSDTNEEEFWANPERARRFGRIRGGVSDMATAQFTMEELITLIGEDPVNFPVDGGRLLMFMPIGAGAVGREVVSETFGGAWSAQTAEYQSRFNIIYDILDRMEFLFFCTPKGDMVIEFPLYDFDPDDFASFEKRFILELIDTFNSSSTVSDANIRTQVQIKLNPTNDQNLDQTIANATTAPVVKIPSLFPVYGTRSEQVNLRGLIQTESAARLYGSIYLNRVNADAHAISVPIVPRFDAQLNRPYRHKVRNHIGTTVSIVHNLQWMGSWRTTLTLNHVRNWTGQLDINGRMIYVPIAGRESRPVNYQVLFGRSKPTVTSELNQGTTQVEVNAQLDALLEDLEGLGGP